MGGFRDQTEALRARVRALEEELASSLEERERLAKRVAALERGEAAGERAERAARASAARKARALWLRNLAERGKVALLLGGFVALMIGGPIFLEQSCADGCNGCGGPDPGAPPSVGVVDLDATPDPARISLSVTGTAGAPGECRGYLPDQPQVVLRTAHPTAIRVAPVAETGDLVAMVRLPDGRVLCDDDGGGSLNPLIGSAIPPGDTRVWIGTYSEGATIQYQLGIHAQRLDELERGAGAGPVLEGPGPGARASVRGSALAPSPASLRNPACPGYLPLSPALTVRLSQPAAVLLDASGADDLVLLVTEPDGSVKCDDDSGPGSAPRIAAMLLAGEHQVFVGTYSPLDREAAFVLEASVHALDPDAPPTIGDRALAAVGDVITVDGTAAGEVAPAALGASCGGGLVPVAPQVVIDVRAERADVLFAIAASNAPFVVIEHPDRAIECVRDAHARVVWGSGRHRVFVGVEGEDRPGAFTLTARMEAPTYRPWRAE